MVNFQLEIIGSVLIFLEKKGSDLAWYPAGDFLLGERRDHRLERFIWRGFQPLTHHCHCEEGALCPTKQSFLPRQKIASPFWGSPQTGSPIGVNNDKLALPCGRLSTRETGEYRRFVLRRLNPRLWGTACVHNIAVFSAKLVLVILIPTHHIHLADALGDSPFNFLS